MDLSAAGIGSGLDVKSLVTALVQAEITPMQTRHDNRLKDVNTSLSAVGQLRSYLSNFQASLAKLSDFSKFYTYKSTISDPDYLSATLSSEAAKGTYQVEVQKLAQQQSLASTTMTNTGSGTLTIQFGTYNAGKTTFTPNASEAAINVTIAPGNDSLAAVRDAINATNSGVTASIVQDSSGSKLTITSNKSGENYSMKISGTVASLNYDPTTGINALTETLGAQNSLVKINGLTISQSTNQVKDAISGVTLNLKKAEVGKTISFAVDDNKDQMTSLINEFVKQYNDTVTFLTNLTGYNTTTKQGGVFQGDPQFRNLKMNITKLATSQLATNNGAINSLADLGIVTNKQGLLEVKQDKLNAALTNNYQSIGNLFAKTAKASDSGVVVNSVNSTVKAGSYSLVLSAYTPGVSMSGTIGGLSASSTDGVTLTGSGSLSGLSVNILSGSTGTRGQVVVTDGIAVQLNTLLKTYMDTKGDLDQRTDQLNNQVKSLSKVQDDIDARTKTLQSRFLSQFTALDILLTSMQSTSSYLTQQLANLPQSKSK
ncbi:flagellar filament capping protein FliD [Legionella waltersii]|uniref:Flagellar hook-associated protein 2 n=1 Tax=Legionella waltersii TaxID=66969 RepID=A0A0W1AM19_9GAMM|nr:flagellar filament capping protein FliD [Legionella waltersii]KTD82358.1 flagellar hook associated protein 2 FliD [Legionella waltersii]SNV03844.1 flagellar hook-associated protein 2 [Legionella waltersii]